MQDLQPRLIAPTRRPRLNHDTVERGPAARDRRVAVTGLLAALVSVVATLAVTNAQADSAVHQQITDEATLWAEDLYQRMNWYVPLIRFSSTGSGPNDPRYDAKHLYDMSYYDEARLVQFQNTRDPAIADQLLTELEFVLDLRTGGPLDPYPDPPETLRTGPTGPRWVSFNRYYTQVANPPRHAWFAHNAQYLSNHLRLIGMIRNDSELHAEFADRIDSIVPIAAEILNGFDHEFQHYSDGVRGLYTDPFYASLGGGTSTYPGLLPLNMQSAAGSAYLGLYQASGEEQYRERAEALALTMKSDLVASGDRYLMAYGQDQRYAAGREDIGHGAVSIAFIVEAYEAGLVFNDTDLARLSNTLRAMKKSNGEFSFFLDGTDHSGTTGVNPAGLANRWLRLAYYEPELRAEMWDHLHPYYDTNNSSSAVYTALAMAHYAVSGESHRPERMFVDRFDGPQISARWRRPSDESLDVFWVTSVQDGALLVRDVVDNASYPSKWVGLTRSREVSPIGSWSVEVDLEWNAAEAGSNALNVEHAFLVQLLDDEGDVFASLGLADLWPEQTAGRQWSLAGTSSRSAHPGELDQVGRALLQIRSLEDEARTELYWDQTMLAEWDGYHTLSEVLLVFGKHYPSQGSANMGDFTIHRVAVNELAAPTVPGDADGDGDVDAFDLGIWQTDFGMTGASLAADFDADGDVDGFDLGLWQTNFGRSAQGVTVPVPSVGVLMVVSALLGVGRQDRAIARGRIAHTQR